jgi:hypothetical protein
MAPQGRVDAARETHRETHAGVGLFVHDAASLCRLHYSIDRGERIALGTWR